MLRGTLVKVNDKCKLKHLVGTTALVVARHKYDERYIKVHQKTSEGFIVDICFKETELDIMEPPVEV